jgi:hypothetical protein
MTEQPKWFEDGGQPEEDRFADGFKDGFGRAREIFWRDFMRKAGDARLMSEQIRELNPLKADEFALMDAIYRSVADNIARSHNLYPGAIAGDEALEGPIGGGFTVNYDHLYRY